MKPCKHETVQPRGKWIWACMLCNERFIPLDKIEQADEQLPVKFIGVVKDEHVSSETTKR